MEKEIIERVIRDNPSLDMPAVAAKLGISRNTLYKRMRELGIETGRKVGRKTGYRKPLSLT